MNRCVVARACIARVAALLFFLSISPAQAENLLGNQSFVDAVTAGHLNSELASCAVFPCRLTLLGQKVTIDANIRGLSDGGHSVEAVVSANGGFISALSTVFLPVEGGYILDASIWRHDDNPWGMPGFLKHFSSVVAPLPDSTPPLDKIENHDAALMALAVSLMGFEYDGTAQNSNGLMCEDQKFGPLDCSGPLRWIGLYPINESDELEKCCMVHDACYRKGIPGTRRGCDLDLWACANSELTVSAVLSFPATNIFMTGTLIFGGYSFGDPPGECHCDWDLPDSVQNKLLKMTQKEMVVGNSACCEDDECVPNKQCPVWVDGVLDGTLIRKRVVWYGKCAKESK
ncbi:MAG: hypothetical protein KDD66_15000 [Bdellovibrionales bacterium]|nr:hypothetical protein [Bdellovibrionales bacterium]